MKKILLFLIPLLILVFLFGGWQTVQAATQIIGSVTNPQLSNAWRVAVSGNYAYVTVPEQDRFAVIDISNPNSPQYKTSIADSTKLNEAYNIFIVGNYAYVTARSGDYLNIINISNPLAPWIQGSISTTDIGGDQLDTPIGVFVSGKYAYVATRYSNRLTVINIENPGSPSYVSSIQDNTFLDGAWDVFIVGNYAYVTVRDTDYLTIINISNPSLLTIEGKVEVRPGVSGDSPYGIYVSGKYAYVSLRGTTNGGNDGKGDGFVIIDVSNPALPVIKGSIFDSKLDGAKGVQMIANHAYVTTYEGSSFVVIDVANPDSPVIQDADSLFNNSQLNNANGIQLVGNYVYVVAGGTSDSLNVITGFPATNVWGWAWSDNIGWISFNSLNCDANSNGLSDGTPAGCPPTGTPIPNYGVNIDETARVFYGYAWSENIGWISFNPWELDGCLVSPCDARVDLVTGNISGWARALAATGTEAGDWDGWIKLRGSYGAGTYGVSLNTATKEFEGWAWGGDDSTSTAVIGWISFNCLNQGVCATSSYKVVTSLNLPPSAINLSVDPPNSADYCGVTEYPPVRIRWEFFDPGDTQSYYQIQIATTSDFSPLVVDTEKIYASNTDPHFAFVVQPPFPTLSWNQAYYWRLRVWDSQNTTSTDWIVYKDNGSPKSFTTLSHSYPRVDFIPSPQSGTVKEVITFKDNSSCPGGTCVSYLWDFDNGTTSSVIGDATTTYATARSYNVKLKITDEANQTCEDFREVNIRRRLPWWREILPF